MDDVETGTMELIFPMFDDCQPSLSDNL